MLCVDYVVVVILPGLLAVLLQSVTDTSATDGGTLRTPSSLLGCIGCYRAGCGVTGRIGLRQRGSWEYVSFDGLCGPDD